MKKYILYLLFSFVALSCFAQFEGGAPGGMPPGGMNGGPGTAMGRPDGKGPDKSKASKKSNPKKEAKEAAKKAKEEEKRRAKAEKDMITGKVPGHVYVFGCSFAFGDSLLYITNIQTVDSITLTRKTKVLPYISDFSAQLKDKLESPMFNRKNQTSSVFYSLKQNKLQKKMTKLKKRYLKNGRKKIVLITDDQFHFVHPLDYFSPTESSK